MSDTPIFFKKTKSKTIKSREAREDDEEITTETKTVVSNFKNRSKGRSKPQQRLSFNTNDEEEGDVNNDAVQVKRSALGKKQKFGIGAAPNSSPGSLLSSRLEQTSITSRSEGPRYDASYLEELKASTNSARPPTLRPNEDGNESNGMVIDNDLTFDASEMEGAIIEEAVDMPLVSQDPVAETMIHSESYVKSAREKRERLRKTGVTDGEADYISLTVARKEEFDPGPHPESRLMREDDDLGEGDDDDAAYTGAQETIALSKKGRKEQEKKRKKGMEELIEEADEQDEETMEWEMAQVKRAVPSEANEVNAQNSQPLTYKPTPIPAPVPVPVFDSAAIRLSQTLTTLTTSHAQNAQAIANSAEQQVFYDKEEANLRRQVDEAEEKRAWFQTFKEQVETVAQFLDEKFPILEKLEEEHISLLKERMEMISKRRMDDNEDDLVLLYGVPADMQASEEPQVDELGRALPSSTEPQSVVRRTRRQRRLHRKVVRSVADSNSTLDEDYATDGSLVPSDAADFEMAISSLKEKVQTVLFKDVKAKAFRDPKHGIAIWFGEWREKWPDIYHNAFGGMGLVQAWEFWARAEMLGWIPFETSPQMEGFKWFVQLHEICRPDPEEVDELRPEDDLPVNMCSTMLIPRLNALIAGGALDPYSSKQLLHVIDLAEQIEASLGTGNVRYSSLLSSVARVFRNSAHELTTQYRRMSASVASKSHRYRLGFDPESVPARQRYMKRTMKLTENIIRWRRYTKERDGLGMIATDLVSQVLYPVAQDGWEVGGEESIRKIAKILPQDLLPTGIKSRLQ